MLATVQEQEEEQQITQHVLDTSNHSSLQAISNNYQISSQQSSQQMISQQSQQQSYQSSTYNSKNVSEHKSPSKNSKDSKKQNYINIIKENQNNNNINEFDQQQEEKKLKYEIKNINNINNNHFQMKSIQEVEDENLEETPHQKEQFLISFNQKLDDTYKQITNFSPDKQISTLNDDSPTHKISISAIEPSQNFKEKFNPERILRHQNWWCLKTEEQIANNFQYKQFIERLGNVEKQLDGVILKWVNKDMNDDQVQELLQHTQSQILQRSFVMKNSQIGSNSQLMSQNQLQNQNNFDLQRQDSIGNNNINSNLSPIKPSSQQQLPQYQNVDIEEYKQFGLQAQQQQKYIQEEEQEHEEDEYQERVKRKTRNNPQNNNDNLKNKQLQQYNNNLNKTSSSKNMDNTSNNSDQIQNIYNKKSYSPNKKVNTVPNNVQNNNSQNNSFGINQNYQNPSVMTEDRISEYQISGVPYTSNLSPISSNYNQGFQSNQNKKQYQQGNINQEKIQDLQNSQQKQIQQIMEKLPTNQDPLQIVKKQLEQLEKISVTSSPVKRSRQTSQKIEPNFYNQDQNQNSQQNQDQINEQGDYQDQEDIFIKKMQQEEQKQQKEREQNLFKQNYFKNKSRVENILSANQSEKNKNKNEKNNTNNGLIQNGDININNNINNINSNNNNIYSNDALNGNLSDQQKRQINNIDVNQQSIEFQVKQNQNLRQSQVNRMEEDYYLPNYKQITEKLLFSPDKKPQNNNIQQQQQMQQQNKQPQQQNFQQKYQQNGNDFIKQKLQNRQYQDTNNTNQQQQNTQNQLTNQNIPIDQIQSLAQIMKNLNQDQDKNQNQNQNAQQSLRNPKNHPQLQVPQNDYQTTSLRNRASLVTNINNNQQGASSIEIIQNFLGQDEFFSPSQNNLEKNNWEQYHQKDFQTQEQIQYNLANKNYQQMHQQLQKIQVNEQNNQQSQQKLQQQQQNQFQQNQNQNNIQSQQQQLIQPQKVSLSLDKFKLNGPNLQQRNSSENDINQKNPQYFQQSQNNSQNNKGSNNRTNSQSNIKIYQQVQQQTPISSQQEYQISKNSNSLKASSQKKLQQPQYEYQTTGKALTNAQSLQNSLNIRQSLEFISKDQEMVIKQTSKQNSEYQNKQNGNLQGNKNVRQFLSTPQEVQPNQSLNKLFSNTSSIQNYENNSQKLYQEQQQKFYQQNYQNEYNSNSYQPSYMNSAKAIKTEKGLNTTNLYQNQQDFSVQLNDKQSRSQLYNKKNQNQSIVDQSYFYSLKDKKDQNQQFDEDEKKEFCWLDYNAQERQELWIKYKQQNQERKINEQNEKQKKICTFKPNLQQTSSKKYHNQSQIQNDSQYLADQVGRDPQFHKTVKNMKGYASLQKFKKDLGFQSPGTSYVNKQILGSDLKRELSKSQRIQASPSIQQQQQQQSNSVRKNNDYLVQQPKVNKAFQRLTLADSKNQIQNKGMNKFFKQK